MFSTVTGFTGGAIQNAEGSSLSIVNSTFIANSAINGGGAIVNVDASLSIINSIFYSNVAITGSGFGGAIYNFSSFSPAPLSVTNSTFYDNTAIEGGAIYNTNNAPTITNSILYGNTGGEIVGGSTVTYSLVQVPAGPGQMTYPGMGNIKDDPLFINASAGDLRLQPNSLAINKGNKDAPLLTNISTDIAGKPRITSTNIDMGAYESAYPIGANGLIYVKPTGTGNLSGDSWANAANGLADALEAARSNEVIKQIWVAQGNYKPDYNPVEYTMNDVTNPRDMTFLLKKDLALYGGFKGDESTIESRNAIQYPTILSGDIGQPNTIDDNTYHVVVAVSTNTSTVVLDGFIIEKGNANGNGNGQILTKNITRNDGGGMYNFLSSPTLLNNIFRFNRADDDGGAIHNINQSSPNITNNTFSDNTAKFGGAIVNYLSPFTIINSIFNSNTADNGGAMANFGSFPALINNTFDRNTATDHGSVMYNNNTFSLITNSILYGDNSNEEIYNFNNSSATVTYSLVQGGYQGTGNLVVGADPLFANANDGDFRLKPGSPAIDAGNNSAIPEYIKTDINGRSRILGKALDMGAYETIPYGVGNAYEQVSNILSPNGDGINDYLVIQDIEIYEQAELKIADMAGRIIYSQSNKSAEPLTWNGMIGSNRVQEGVYFFILTFGPGKNPAKGAITVVY